MEKLYKENINQKVIQKLKTIKDLELPINIYDLGLIYNIEVEDKDGSLNINIEATIINSRCSSTKSFTDLIIETVESIEEVDRCNVRYVYSPKWEVTMISARGLDMLKSAN